ncbi:MAG: nuclear transport factor 2 family protein [Polyangiales bacterium]
MSPDEVAVLAANRAFYEAFRQGDARAMDELWARKAPIACLHPGWDALRGRTKVMASWRAILSGGEGPAIRCSGATAHVLGDAAYVLCYETIDDTRLIATNTFVREREAWRLVHHQAAPVAREGEDDADEDEADGDPDSDLPTGGGVLN